MALAVSLSLKCFVPHSSQVQVQEAGEGVATGKGVGPWTVSVPLELKQLLASL